MLGAGRVVGEMEPDRELERDRETERDGETERDVRLWEGKGLI